MSKYIIEEQTLSDIADKIREKKYQDNEMTPLEMVDEIDEMGLPWNIYEYPNYYYPSQWVRPLDYPNLELIDLTDFDGVYLTYDLRKIGDKSWIGIYTERTSAKNIYFERGHLDSNNEFVVDEQYTTTTNKYYFRQLLDSTNGDVQLWRVYSPEAHLICCKFATYTATQADNLLNTLQPCVERRGRLPYITNCASSRDDRNGYWSWSTQWLERDDVRDVVSVTSMASAYSHSYNLEQLCFTGWDTSKVTTFASCFYGCINLHTIPINAITTPKATALNSMFVYCWALGDSIDISHFDLTKVTTMTDMFRDCYSMKHIKFPLNGGTGALTRVDGLLRGCNSLQELPENLENLNVTNVTTVSYLFGNCYSIKDVDLSSWNITKITSLTYMCQNCRGLIHADFHGWNTSLVVDARNCFDSCWNLKRINIDGWDLSNATNVSAFYKACRSLESSDILNRIDFTKVTTLASVCNECYALKEVIIGDCDVTNSITSINNMFTNCYSIREISMPDMHFSQPVTMAEVFYGCHSLTNLDISGWHVEALRAFSGFFAYCYQLPEVDLSDWIVDDGALTAKNTLNYLFNSMISCKSIKIPFAISLSNGSVSYMFDYCPRLEYIDIRNMDFTNSSNIYLPNNSTIYGHLQEFYPPTLPAKSFSIQYNGMLSKDSLLRIIDKLPTVSTAVTITFGKSNKLKLTDEELAVATNKGWTVA